ncbi:MAG: glycosyltransferase, partial [Flavobacteriaceae bacterium]|nr:glycosyltransferase [Flavobacteriaceae bacterium]
MAESLIIIPTYNEIDNIAAMIKAVMLLPEMPDLLVVDDSSPDGTAAAVEALQKDYPKRLHLEVRKKKDGLGRAYIHGFNWALSQNYVFIIEMDADFSHDPKDVSKLIKACKKGADVAIGS